MIEWIKNNLWKSHKTFLNSYCGDCESEEYSYRRDFEEGL